MTSTWRLLFAGGEPIDETRRRLRLVGESLEGRIPKAGRRIALLVSKGGAGLKFLCRVEHFDASELRLDLILPIVGDAAAVGWVQAAAIGDHVVAELVSE